MSHVALSVLFFKRHFDYPWFEIMKKVIKNEGKFSLWSNISLGYYYKEGQMVLSINFPRDFDREAKIVYIIEKNNLLLEGYGCYNPALEKCRNCKLRSFEKGDILDMDIDDIKQSSERGCSEKSQIFFSLKFDLDDIKGVKIS